MANVNGKKVIDEITLDDEEDNDITEYDELRDYKETLTKFNASHIEQGRGDRNGFYCDEDDSMDYEEITRNNQPVDFIFAVEDDEDETEFDSQKVFSRESPKKSNSVKSAPDTSGLIRSTRSALRQQPNLQNGHSTPSPIPSTTKSVERKKVKSSEPVNPNPTKQLRSSVRETRNGQNKPIPQSTPNEPKVNGKRSTNTPSNSTPSTQPTPTESKNTKKVTNSTANASSAPTVGPKSIKKSLNGVKEAAKTTEIAKATPNGKQNGMTNGSAKSNQKTKNLSPKETPTTATDKQAPLKKRTRAYWTGKEHIRQVGPETPFVMIERLPLFLSGDTEYKGHDCSVTVCPSKKNLVKRNVKSPAPPPRIEPFDSISATINSVVEDVPLSPNMPPGRPKIGQNIRFQFWQTPLGNNVPVKSSFQKAKIISYNAEYDLYEIQLFHYDHPFIISSDKPRNQRITTNKMIIDWNSLADPSII